MYTIQQVAKITGISAHTLRFYDKQGLFPYVKRNENNVRLFSEEDLEWVSLVQCLRETGMPLAKIREFVHLCLLGDSTIPQRYELIQNQVQKAEQELAAMKRRIQVLKKKVEYYKGLLDGNPDIYNPVHIGSTATD